MKKVPRGDMTVIKDMLYPEKKQNNKLWQKKNMQNIKEQEERNKRLKEEKENHVEPELYKLKQFLNVESKIKKETQDWNTEQNKLKPKSVINNNRPKNSNVKVKISNRDNIISHNYNNSNEENIYGINNIESNSLFDQYYRNKTKTNKSFVGINARPLSQQNVFGEEVNFQVPKKNVQVNNQNNNNIKGNRNDQVNMQDLIQQNYLNNNKVNNNNMNNNNLPSTRKGNYNDVNIDELKDEEINLLLQQYNEQLSKNESIIKKNDIITNSNMKNMKNLESDSLYPQMNNIIPNENIYKQPTNISQNNINNNIQESIYQQQIPQSQIPLNNNNNMNEIAYNDIPPENLESNYSKNPKDEEIEKLIKDYTEKYGWDETIEQLVKEYTQKGKIESEEKYLSNQNNMIKQDYNKPYVQNKNSPLILPKIQKNFIKDNRQLVIENKVPQRTKPKEQQSQAFHKDYGKTPLYIKKYEIESQIRKEEKKRRDEEKKYPKGTKLLSEEERVSTLNGLINSKKEITNLLEKMPITTRTIAIQNKKEELIQKLEEIEKAIDMFSKKQVFIKI